MIKLVSFIVKRDGMTTAAFRDYYERYHAPLVLSVSRTVSAYHRNYVDQGSTWSGSGTAGLGIDAVTEMWFADAEAYAAQQDVMRRPDVRRRLADDEAKFMRRDLTRIFRVDEVVSPMSATAR